MTPRVRNLLLVFLAGMASVNLLLVWRSRILIREGYPDFTTFYCAGKILRQGDRKQLFDEQTQYRVQQEFASGVRTRQGPLPYLHPAFEAPLFVPFTYFSYLTAYLFWNFLNVVIILGSYFLLKPHVYCVRRISLLVWILGATAFFPIFFCFLQGQDSILLLLCLLLTFILLKEDRDFLAGCCLALGLFRFHLVLPIALMLAWRKKWIAINGFLATGFILVLISIGIVGWEQTLKYPNHVLLLEQHMERHKTIVPVRMPSLRGLFDSILIPLGSKWTSDISIAVVSIVMVLWAASKWDSLDRKSPFLGVAVCVIVDVLVGYHTLPYDLTLLLLPMVFWLQYLLDGQSIERRRQAILFSPVFVLLFTPIHAYLVMRSGRYSLMVLLLFLWLLLIIREAYRRGNEPKNWEVAS